MTRRHAWAPDRRARPRSARRAVTGRRRPSSPGLTAEGLIAPFVLDGPMDRAVFTEYVRQMLVPELKPGDIVILDNLPGHKGEEAAELVEAARREAPLPAALQPRSQPDRDAVRKLKAMLRKAERRTRDALWRPSANSSTTSPRRMRQLHPPRRIRFMIPQLALAARAG